MGDYILVYASKNGYERGDVFLNADNDVDVVGAAKHELRQRLGGKDIKVAYYVVREDDGSEGGGETVLPETVEVF